MNKSNAHKPAFARAACIDPESGHVISGEAPGLTKREYIAALALQGLIARTGMVSDWEQQFAAHAVALADALLAALEVQP